MTGLVGRESACPKRRSHPLEIHRDPVHVGPKARCAFNPGGGGGEEDGGGGGCCSAQGRSELNELGPYPEAVFVIEGGSILSLAGGSSEEARDLCEARSSELPY